PESVEPAYCRILETRRPPPASAQTTASPNKLRSNNQLPARRPPASRWPPQSTAEASPHPAAPQRRTTSWLPSAPGAEYRRPCPVVVHQRRAQSAPSRRLEKLPANNS